MGDHYEVVSFYYDAYENLMTNDDGEIVFDIFRLIPPRLYNLYKQRPGTYYQKSKTNSEVMYEFVFPLEDEEDDDF
jgi:hypothetical protein